MEKKKNLINIYILSFLVTFALYVIIGLALRLYPISDRTLIFSDMYSQFSSFYTYFKYILTTNDNIFYTFSKNLGGDMIGFMAYYLQSPFQFLLLLFPYKLMPLGIYLMEITALSTASLTFQVFLNKVFGKTSFIFSTAYGMIGMVLVFFTLPLYQADIAMLPLIVTFLYLMLSEKEGECKYKLLYAISLFLSIIFNYYIAYMICIFLVLVFLCYSYLNFTDLKDFIQKIKIFASTSIIAALLSAFELIPVVFSLSGQKEAPSASIFELKRMFRLIDLYKCFIPGGYPVNDTNMSLPHIYVSLIPIVCIFVFFISRKIKIKEKVAAAVFILTLIFSMYIKPLDTIWHAFNEPSGFAHRFAFCLCFVLLTVGFKGYLLVKEFLEEKYVKTSRVLFIAVFAFAMLDLLYNGYSVLSVHTAEGKSQSYIAENYDRIQPLISGIKENEDKNALYRIEKDIQYSMEDPMAFDYAGLSHYSSCEPAFVKEFLDKLGFRTQTYFSFYNQGSTAFVDSFLSVKYLISRFDTTDKPYNSSFNIEDTYVFSNPYALSFASIVDRDRIDNVDVNTGNTFIFQNEIASSYGLDKDIFTEASVSEIRLSGDIDLGEDFINRANANKVPIITVTDGGRYLEFDVDVKESDKILYMYFAAKKMQGARLYVNGIDWDDYFSDWRWNVERVGKYTSGDKVTIRMEVTSDEFYIGDYQLYYEDLVVLSEWYDNAAKLGAESVNLTKKSSSHLVGSFEAFEGGTLMFSLPYDEGWSIKVDGKKVDNRMVLDALMAIDVESGQHEIEMVFIPRGIVIGSVISAITLLLSFVYITFRKPHVR